MSGKRRNTLIGLAALAAGVAVGAGLEELVYRRVLRRRDPEAHEPIGSLAGDTIWISTFDGTRIHARAYGPADAPLTLVFAHGVLESHVVWHYQVRDLVAEGGVRLIAYDARGHGASGPARGPDARTPFTEYTLARDLVAVLEQATAGPAVLVGHSMGGITIQALWQHGEIRHVRDRVAGAALVNTTYTVDIRGWRGGGSRAERTLERIEDLLQQLPLSPRMINRLRPRKGADLPLLVARLFYGTDPSPRHIATSVRVYEGTPSATLAAAVDLARFDAHDALALMDVPVLVVAGTKDFITPQWLSEEIATRVPDAELVVFEGCGHMAPFERYDELTEHLRKFCGRLDRGDADHSHRGHPEPRARCYPPGAPQ